MDAVLERLGLPAELSGATPAGKGKEPADKAKGSAAANGKETKSKQAEAVVEAEETQVEPEPEAEEVAEPAAKEVKEVPEAETEAQATEPEFTEEQKAWLEEQNQSRATELERSKGEATSAQERIKELEAQLTAAGQTPRAIAAIHPMFLVDDPALLVKEEQAIAEFEKWALEHWDGVEATEASADGKTAATPGYTAAQVRKRYAEMKEVRDKVIPQARQAIETRKEQAKIAKQEYPELFDSKRPEAQLVEQILRQAPGLKAIFPNIYLVLGDAMRGEKARIAARKAAKPTVKPAADGTNGKPKPPRPGAGAGPAVKPSKKGNEISAERFMKLGGGRDALVEMLSGAELPTAES